jgi:hypothetical protein
MSTTADLQNLTRRFWRGQTSSALAGGEILEIVSMDEIAELSGFTPKSLRVFSGRDDFPSPVARVKRRLFWRKDDVCNWIKAKTDSNRRAV